MIREDCKDGVRVKWDARDSYNNPDRGVIVEQNGSVFNDVGSRYVWVKWDSNGAIQYIDRHSIDEDGNAPEMTEEQAVMFLLSKGYTVYKG